MIFARIQAWLATSALTLALGAALGAGGVLTWEHHAPFGWGLAQRLEKAVEAKRLVEADLKQCRENTDTLKGAIEDQNASIDRWKAEAEAAKDRASRAVEAAQRRSATARRDAASIMAREPGGDLCQSALELLREP